MFLPETAKEAWAYWRWRVLRSLVAPGVDYQHLARIISEFDGRVFIETSNCDQLHLKAGIRWDMFHEIHGSLGRLQCSGPCSDDMMVVDEEFLENLRSKPDWVPPCPKGCGRCLRPNVMIFNDDTLIDDEIQAQKKRLARFRETHMGNLICLEIGAGVVVPSIRCHAESTATKCNGLIRINPSEAECLNFELSYTVLPKGKYWPLPMKSGVALSQLADRLQQAPRPRPPQVYVIHRGWPFDTLLARRSPDGQVVAAAPYDHSADTFILTFLVDEDKSTATQWKLARGAKARFITAGVLIADYDELSEGWIVKDHCGHQTLEFYRSGEKQKVVNVEEKV